MLYHLGRYIVLLRSLFFFPDKISIYRELIFKEMHTMGIGSLAIVMLTSVFIGAVTAVQTAYQLTNALIPVETIGMVVTQSTLLELAPTITCLVLAGKIGSNIASEIGTMRVTEQIDALEVMGLNAAGYLIFPKLLSSLLIFPILVTISAAVGITGGVLAGHLTGSIPISNFVNGAREIFHPFEITFMLIKAITFGFVISTISSYQGYYTSGGALEVGRASTRAVVFSCVYILFSDYILAQILL